jgi:hypothetical protein
VFKPLFPLFPSEALEAMKQSGIFALSVPGRLEEVLAAAHLTVQIETEIETPIVFDNADAAVRAFLGAGPTALAIRHQVSRQLRRRCGTPSVPSLAHKIASRSLAGIGSYWLEVEAWPRLRPRRIGVGEISFGR